MLVLKKVINFKKQIIIYLFLVYNLWYNYIKGDSMKNIFIIGSRGYQANYGGWETFVTNLVDNYNDKKSKFYVTELTHNKNDDNKIIKKNKAQCIEIYSKNLGFVTMFIYAIKALKSVKRIIKNENLENCIIYVLGCRIGPFYKSLIKPLKKRNIKIFLNPDGLEWKREKWAWWIKKCFKISERCMVKNSDYIICDSEAIKDYIDKTYYKYHKTSYFIAYGAYLNNKTNNKKAEELFKKYNIKEDNYYLLVGRFVPENNYELIIKEFMKTNTKKDLVIISNYNKEDKFYQKLNNQTNFEKDNRIKFIGSVYEKEALIYIRQNAYAYIHGHSAGGTNPSLLEALANTKINILFNAVYNIEVGLNGTLYFSKKENNLKTIIEKVDNFSKEEIEKYAKLAKNRIKEDYTWEKVVTKYKEIFR